MSNTLGLLTWDVSTSYLDNYDIFPRPRPPIVERTKGMYAQLFPKVPIGKNVILSTCAVIGEQGCGKTSMFKSLYETAKKRYKGIEINVINTDSLEVAFDMMDDKPVQLIFVDDASRYQSSRQPSKNIQLVADFNRSRHIYEERSGRDNGVVIEVFGFQRYKDLDIALRSQMGCTIFKTFSSDATDQRPIYSFIGKDGVSALNEIWSRIRQGEQRMKSYGIIRFNSEPIQSGVAFVNVPMVESPDFPDLCSQRDREPIESESEPEPEPKPIPPKKPIVRVTEQGEYPKCLEPYLNDGRKKIAIECWKMKQLHPLYTLEMVAKRISESHPDMKPLSVGGVSYNLKVIDKIIEDSKGIKSEGVVTS